MKTENEIRGMSLEDKQKFVVDLMKIGPNDKAYANAKALIEFTKGLIGWKEPVTIKAKNVAGHDIKVDGVAVSNGGEGTLYIWQYRALARWFEAVAEADHALAFPEPKKEKAPKDGPTTPVALLIGALLLFGSLFSGLAQNQAYVAGSPGRYNVLSIAGLNGGTNSLLGTNTFTASVITTNQIISPVWYNSNGISYFNTTTNNTYSTNQPGVVSLVNYDLADVYWGFALTTAGTGTAGATWDYSPDLVNWQLNALTTTLVANGTTMVSTNINLSAFAPGYLRLDTEWYPSPTVGQTNVVVEVGRKVSKTGP